MELNYNCNFMHESERIYKFVVFKINKSLKFILFAML